ncbi:MAG: VCBS repeat-containing protein [Bacteroidales bacterium]|nr:VCBS repeat-containing protein [Bacteroidales bacterium]
MAKTRQLLKFGLIFCLFILHWSCNRDDNKSFRKPLFTLISDKHTRIDFINQLEYTEEFNTYTYRNFYNGAGVGIGDFNNDGLPDIYFCGNLADNKLYINRGDFVFEDITNQAGVACSGAWSTGVSITDINGDGWLDIFVCKSGDPGSANRHNDLFINNKDLTFSEKAEEYGLSDAGLSNHASFFDYDRDGDLDCYLLNNSFQSVTEFDIKPDQRQIRDSLGANKLYRNDGNHFVDVSEDAGIFGSKIGFGLGVSVGDLNRDGWPDIYISNDFFERDYLYINNRNGTFTESLEDQLRETSLGAMGADIADINNDAYPDIFVTEMTPEGNSRLKTKVMFEDWNRYQMKLKNGYYHQFARNVLQLNTRNGSFSEIGRQSGVSATDWSWGALIMDLDNDGWNDIFVANGIYKDLLDRDYLDIYSNPSVMRSIINTEEKAILKVIDMIPSVKIPNYAFHNNGNLTFSNNAEPWGLGDPSFSNGAAYGDLDNDGDLDLIVNNVNMPPFVYRNDSDQKSETNFLVTELIGTGKNSGATGASVTLYYQGKINYREVIPARGFMSSVDKRLHFGLGSATLIDSLVVKWPDGNCSKLINVQANQFLKLDESKAEKGCLQKQEINQDNVFQQIDQIMGLDYAHTENDFSDFDRDRLLFQMISNEGPHITVGDVNGDLLDDLYLCGAKDSPGALFVQVESGNFRNTNTEIFKADKISEDTDCAFFDADGDGDNDLYVASGGNEFPSSSSALGDRLYLNDGKGNFSKSDQIFPDGKYESTSCVQPADFDKDGDIDLFVGVRLLPFSYGVPVNGYILENDGHGNYSNITEKAAPSLVNIGMITDMVWADIDNDSDLDMVIVGDWMPVKVLINDKNTFIDKTAQYDLSETQGWWHTITAKDLNNDGNVDFILGNQGLNSFFKASVKKPVTMYVNDFDLNGSTEQIICTYDGNKSFPAAMKDDLVKQISSLETKYKSFNDYRDQTIEDIFPPEVLKRSVILNARIMESCLLVNSGKGSLKLSPLPSEAQFTPVYAISANDFDDDGLCDIVLGGNLYRAKPEKGIYDAGYGLFLKGKSNGSFQSTSANESGIFIKGEIRDLKIININGIRVLVVAKNNDNFQFYKF